MKVISKIIGILSGKYAFYVSMANKVIPGAWFLSHASSDGEVRTIVLSCASLMLIDLTWYAGVWLIRRSLALRQLSFA